MSAEGARRQAASGLPQIQQVVDPNNAEVPQDDQLPAGVMFPIDPAFSAQWSTGPQGAQPKGGGTEHEGARHSLPQAAAYQWGHSHALEGSGPMHKSEWQYSPQRHGDYLRSYNRTTGLIHGQVGRAPMSKQEYSDATGRPDLHGNYLAAYADGRTRHSEPGGNYEGGITATGSVQVTADTWSQPRQSTDDLNPPYNSAATTPPMHQDGGDYQAGLAAGKADKAAGTRPAFADNSSAVSPYVKGYAEGYSGSPRPAGTPDVPYSMGGDNGQAQNSGQAQRSFQVAQAARKAASLRRVSAAFAPDTLMADPEFRKGYLFASKWQLGKAIVSVGSAKFEAGLYAGITDRPGIQAPWLAVHAKLAAKNPPLRRRIELHKSFTRKAAQRAYGRVKVVLLPGDAYMPHLAGVTTDLITDGPGTSPDPMGSTPLNGPGTPPPMGGLADPARPGGPSPYQGAPPLGGGPVVPDDVMGRSRQQPTPSGPFTQTFSGEHKENITLAPVAPNSADQPGYSNKDAYRGDPDRVDSGPEANPKMAAFRATVQANLTRMGARQ